MADSKWEIGENLRATLRDIITLITLLVSIWAGVKASNAEKSADDNGSKLTRVGEEVTSTRNDARKTMGLPPVTAQME